MRSGSSRAELQAGVGQGQLGRGHPHLTLAAHHLQPLADRLFLLLFQRAEVVDLAAELPGLGPDRDRHGICWPGEGDSRIFAGRSSGRVSRPHRRGQSHFRWGENWDSPHAAAALRKPFPKGFLAASQRTNGCNARDNNSSRGLRHALTNAAVSGRFSAIRSGCYRLPAAHLGIRAACLPKEGRVKDRPF